MISTKSHKCRACGSRTSASGDYCQTCRSKRHHARKRIAAESLIVEQAGGAWWIWDKVGNVLVVGRASEADAITALALGDGLDDQEDS